MTLPMEQAPQVVQRALNILKEQVGIECPNFEPFNEILSVGYLQGMAMKVRLISRTCYD